MKITLHDAEGFAVTVRKGLHAFVTAYPVASCLLCTVVAGFLGHVIH